MKKIKCVLLLFLLSFLPFFSGQTWIGSEPANISRIQDYDYVGQWPRRNNPIHMVVAFTKFRDENTSLTGPPEWASRLFDGQTGSVPHYFDTVSHGQIKVTGEVLPTLYELPREKDFYGVGINASQYVNDVLYAIDSDSTVNLAQYDNDGPDGIPGSGDDDGYVDYIVMMPLSQPYNFIQQSASGISTLGNAYYTTNDMNEKFELVKIDAFSGCLVNGANFDIACGTLCHEYIHSFGAHDLYDLYYTDEETESAGVGFWCVMGYGTMGWDWDGGPLMPCAYTRISLGCIGINNDRLIDVYGIHRDIRIRDAAREDGTVYRVWIDRNEYFLIENRRNTVYYDREIPRNGLMIWHVLDKTYTNNGQEEMKRCDLECADGLYQDAGYPLGTYRKPDGGRDNLDFWSRNSAYALSHAGNLGDSTDVFDGITYRNFGPYTNPNTNSALGSETGIEIFNIHQDGEDMLFDINTSPFIDWSKVRFPLIGTGFNRFNLVYRDLPNIGNSADVYLVNYGNGRQPEEFVAVSGDSLSVIDVTGADALDIQTMVEQVILGANTDYSNAMIVRENIAPGEFTGLLDRLGVETPKSAHGDPAWVQKIGTPRENGDHPAEIYLYQNYPNPFNTATTITYLLTKGQEVTLDLFAINGQKIRSMDQGYRTVGVHTVRFGAEGLSSGIYLFRIHGETVSETRKLVYIR